MLRVCANAPTPQNVHKEANQTPPGPKQDSNALQQGHSLSPYDLTVADLKSSTAWKDNQDVQMWLSTYWLTIPKVKLISSSKFHGACI